MGCSCKTMGMYFISDRQKQSGPHTPLGLRDLWISGEVSDDARVRAIEKDDWQSLVKIMPGLQSEEGKSRQRNLRFKNVVNLIDKLPPDTDYVDLEPAQRKHFAELFAEICGKPLDEWSTREKTIFKFWRDIGPHRYAETINMVTQQGGVAHATRPSSSTDRLLTELKAIHEQSSKTKWAARSAAIAIWLIIIFGFKIFLR